MVSLEPVTGHVVAAEHAARVLALPARAAGQRTPGTPPPPGPDSIAAVLPSPGAAIDGDLQRARSRLVELLRAGRFEALRRPALIVLDVDDGRARARSVVGDLPATAFTDGTVLPHEAVDAERVAALRRHLEVVGAVSTPVSVAHTDDEDVDRIVEQVTAPAPHVHVADDRGEVRLWVVDDAADGARLRAALGATGGWLIADGHHRAAAARDVGRVLVALTPDRQLSTRAFHRRLTLTRPAEAAEVAEVLRAAGLAVTELDDPAPPHHRGETVVAAAGRWWRVDLRPGTGDPAADLDAVRAEAQILAPLAAALGDGRAPVPLAPQDEVARLQVDGAVTVLLHPPALAEVRRVVAAGATLPAKSTFVAPKHRPGLLVVPRGHGLP